VPDEQIRPKFRGWRLVLIAAAVLHATALLASPVARAGTECTGRPDCTSVPGPWVVVAPTEKTIFPSLRSVDCPAGQGVVGADFVYANPSTIGLLANLTLFDPGTGPIFGRASAGFLAVNVALQKYSYRPLLGCSPNVTQARSAARVVHHRILTRTVRPGRVTLHLRLCHRGERLVASANSAGFETRRPPSRRVMNQLAVGQRQRGDRITVSVGAGPLVGDNERVSLQVHADCLR
jgi:hypothetical protein